MSENREKGGLPFRSSSQGYGDYRRRDHHHYNQRCPNRGVYAAKGVWSLGSGLALLNCGGLLGGRLLGGLRRLCGCRRGYLFR